MVEIPELVRAKLTGRSFWQFVTTNEDGSASATPVWADLDGEHVLVNTAIGRLKERNVRRDPRVVLATFDLEDPYAWIEIKGQVVEIVEGPDADETIDRLSKKYLGLDRYAGPSSERRVLLRIEPNKINFKVERGSEISRKEKA